MDLPLLPAPLIAIITQQVGLLLEARDSRWLSLILTMIMDSSHSIVWMNMALIILYTLPLLLLLHRISSTDSKIPSTARRYSFVTQFDATLTQEQALLHYRSLLSNHKSCVDVIANDGEHRSTFHCSCIAFHACITGVSDSSKFSRWLHEWVKTAKPVCCMGWGCAGMCHASAGLSR